MHVEEEEEERGSIRFAEAGAMRVQEGGGGVVG